MSMNPSKDRAAERAKEWIGKLKALKAEAGPGEPGMSSPILARRRPAERRN